MSAEALPDDLREIINIATSTPDLSVCFTKDDLLKLAEYRAKGGQT